MRLSSLQLSGVRNLVNAKLNLHPAVNLFFGSNGSGKTSILEAINLLSLGRSFRTHELQSVINYQERALSCYGEVTIGDVRFSLGVEKRKNSALLCQYKGQTDISLAKFMGNLALQSITPDSFNLLSAGPEIRRKFVDLGVFHVEHQFVELSVRYKKLLKQRNAALKQMNASSLLPAWDGQIISVAEALHKKRISYLEGFMEVFQDVASIFLPDLIVKHQYFSGWNKEQAFSEALLGARDRDLRFKTTTVGPHRADLKLTTSGFPVQQVLSRGQQKLLVCALILAQSLHLFKIKEIKSVFVIDDLASELDRGNLKLILDWLFDLGHQVFLTSVETSAWEALYPNLSCKMFHVERGKITEEWCDKKELLLI